MMRMNFSAFANRASSVAGRPLTFTIAAGAVVLWAVLGPVFDFSDGWQLTINTGTTIITFLMVFLIQNTQNRDSRAMQIKLDELIRATMHAHNALLDLEELSEDELEAFRKAYLRIAEKARKEGLVDEEGRPAVVLPGNGGPVLVEARKKPRTRRARRRQSQ
jgi:low affinity Fe/Cu permease